MNILAWALMVFLGFNAGIRSVAENTITLSIFVYIY